MVAVVVALVGRMAVAAVIAVAAAVVVVRVAVVAVVNDRAAATAAVGRCCCCVAEKYGTLLQCNTCSNTAHGDQSGSSKVSLSIALVMGLHAGSAITSMREEQQCFWLHPAVLYKGSCSVCQA